MNHIMKLFIAFLALCFYKINASYDNHLIETALNISQSAYCLSKTDLWDCATCSPENNYETKVDKNSELLIFGYNNDYKCMFVGFRGSSNIKNWIWFLYCIAYWPLLIRCGITAPVIPVRMCSDQLRQSSARLAVDRNTSLEHRLGNTESELQ